MEHGHNSGLSKQITLIMACDGNFNIGKDGTMLFHIPKDLARYKKITMGKNLYCGRKTFDDMGPLKGRRIIVLSRGEVPKADKVIHDFDEFKKELMNDPDGYFVGGASLTKKLYPDITKILMTRVFETFDADTGIGDPEDHGFVIAEESEIMEDIGLHFKYVTYVRK